MRAHLPFQPPALQNDLIDANYRYQEYLPSRGLETWVACYWTVNFHASNQNKLHRIIPDGCTDIIFDLRSSFISNGAFVTGLMTTFETMNLSRHYSLFGIRFYSATVRHFIRYPVSELSGNRVFLEDIWGNEALLLMEEVRVCTGISEIIEKVENKLITKLVHNESKIDSLLQASVRCLYANHGIGSIRALAEELNYSERNIRRIFERELGVSPKELSDIIRFQSLLKELHQDKHIRFIDAAQKFGYYDQPHLIKVFKRYYGLSPNQVFQRSLGLQ